MAPHDRPRRPLRPDLRSRPAEPGAAKEQVSKTAGELVQLSQRLRDTVRKEVSQQLHSMGAATQEELDALRKRVRDLERSAGMTASGRSSAGRKTAASKPSARTPSTRKKSGAKKKTTSARRKPSSGS